MKFITVKKIKLGYKNYIVRIECSKEVIKERLSKRIVDENNYSQADYNGYLWMKEKVERVPLDLIDLTINTENDMTPQEKI